MSSRRCSESMSFWICRSTPFPRLEKWPEINRRVTRREYERLIDYALEKGVTNAFIQEGSVAKESFVPQWNGEGV